MITKSMSVILLTRGMQSVHNIEIFSKFINNFFVSQNLTIKISLDNFSKHLFGQIKDDYYSRC